MALIITLHKRYKETGLKREDIIRAVDRILEYIDKNGDGPGDAVQALIPSELSMASYMVKPIIDEGRDN